MHTTGMLRSVRKSIVFGEGERIHIGSKANGLSWTELPCDGTNYAGSSKTKVHWDMPVS
jgi:hypothetical protein